LIRRIDDVIERAVPFAYLVLLTRAWDARRRQPRSIEWSEGDGPTVLRMEHLPKLIESGKFFARKFDACVDAAILDALDEHIAATDARPVSHAP
jgi:hypothetical protein